MAIDILKFGMGSKKVRIKSPKTSLFATAEPRTSRVTRVRFGKKSKDMDFNYGKYPMFEGKDFLKWVEDKEALEHEIHPALDKKTTDLKSIYTPTLKGRRLLALHRGQEHARKGLHKMADISDRELGTDTNLEYHRGHDEYINKSLKQLGMGHVATKPEKRRTERSKARKIWDWKVKGIGTAYSKEEVENMIRENKAYDMGIKTIPKIKGEKGQFKYLEYPDGYGGWSTGSGNPPHSAESPEEALKMLKKSTYHVEVSDPKWFKKHIGEKQPDGKYYFDYGT